MKKLLKLLILAICFIPFVNINAETKEKYVINKYYINSEIEIAGALNVKQFIEFEGEVDEYILDFATKKLNTIAYTGIDSDLEGSDIYNPTSIDKLKVGVLKEYEELDLSSLVSEGFTDKIEFFTSVEAKDSNDANTFSLTSDDDGTFSIKINDDHKSGKVVYYLEYVITNILVEHNDSAEFYYPFFTKNFKDDIKKVQIAVALPYPADKVYEVYAHGPKTAIVNTDEEKRGVVSQILNYKSNTLFDLRVLFDKEFFSININESKKSGLDALPIIEKIESERKTSTKKNDLVSNISKIGILSIEGIYILFILGISAYSYVKILRKGKNKNKLEYNSKLNLSFYLLGIIGIIIFVADVLLNISFVKYIVLGISILFILYVILFLSKRKKK